MGFCLLQLHEALREQLWLGRGGLISAFRGERTTERIRVDSPTKKKKKT
jgi:hypothetical protein